MEDNEEGLSEPEHSAVHELKTALQFAYEFLGEEETEAVIADEYAKFYQKKEEQES